MPLNNRYRCVLLTLALLGLNWKFVQAQTNSGEIQLSTQFDLQDFDPTDEFRKLVQAKQWDSAADALVRLRDSKSESLINQSRPESNPATSIELLLAQRRHVNLIANDMFSRHPELRQAWSARIKARLAGQIKGSFESRDAANDFAERFAYDKEYGSSLLVRSAHQNAQDGRLADAVRLLSLADSRLHAYHPGGPRSITGRAMSLSDSDELDIESANVAELAAQLMLLESFRRPEWDDSWLQFDFNPDLSTEGRLGNRTGNLLELLREALPTMHGADATATTANTTNNDPARFESWTIPIKPLEENEPEQPVVRPIIVGNKVMWRNRDQIFAASIKNGLPYFPVSNSNSGQPTEPDFTLWQNVRKSSRSIPVYGLQRFDLSHDDEKVFGVFDFGDSNTIIGIDLRSQGRLLPGFPIVLANTDWQFEGAPVVADGLLYVVARKYEAGSNQIESFIQCYALRMNETASPLVPKWTTPICRSQLTVDAIGSNQDSIRIFGQQRPGGARLTLHQSQVLFCNDLGAIGCLRASTGKIEWLVSYPRLDHVNGNVHQSRLPANRHGQQPLVFGDSMFAMPRHSSLILSINRHSGLVNWKTSLPANSQLLDCNRDSLLVGGDQLVWLDRRKGNVICRFPESQPNGLPGMRRDPDRGWGKPALVRDPNSDQGGDQRFCYPTRQAIYIIDRDPKPADSGKNQGVTATLWDREGIAGGGHLKAENGMMLIANDQSIQAIPIPLNKLQQERKRK